MNKMKSFLVGIILLAIVFAMIIAAALIYRANERSTIKSYIFQLGNGVNQRVGEMQDINNISEKDLRNRLIKKYVSKYFKVIPGDANVSSRPLLRSLSSPEAFNQWKNQEAKTIASMSAKKMFRIARIDDAGISTVNRAENISYKTDELAKSVYYKIHYNMYTWRESNVMKTEPEIESGVIYIEAKFKPGIRPNDEIKHDYGMSLRKYLESGNNPLGLFMFKVVNVGNKVVK